MKNNCGSLEVLRWTGFLLKEKKIRSSFFFIEIFLSFKKESVDTFEIGARWREKIRSTFLLRIDRTPKRHKKKTKNKTKENRFLYDRIAKKSHFFLFSISFSPFDPRHGKEKKQKRKWRRHFLGRCCCFCQWIGHYFCFNLIIIHSSPTVQFENPVKKQEI